MKTIETAKAKSSLAEYSRKVKKEPVVVMTDGRPVAVLVGIKNADMETVALSGNPRFLALIERSRGKSKGAISSEEMRKRLRLNR